jgi:hypothetical protein
MPTIETLTSDKLEAQTFHTTRPVALDFYQASCPPCGGILRKKRNL